MNKRFSERMGLAAPRSLQTHAIDTRLRNRLHSLVRGALPFERRISGVRRSPGYAERICDEYFGLSVAHASLEVLDRLIDNLFTSGLWNDVYDFVEFAARTLDGSLRKRFIGACNQVLRDEIAGYRLDDTLIVPVSSDVELESVAEARTNPRDEVRLHLERAERLLALRPVPDCANVIKEAMSAVEAMARVVADDENATLGDALKTLKQRGVPLHPALSAALAKLYGWTSDDSGGIRHAAKSGDVTALDEPLARFILVTCSAYVNYLASWSEGR